MTILHTGHVQQLNKAAEIFIQDFTGIHPTTAEIVRNCVIKYSTPPLSFETLAWIKYRIWNAVKSIFGQSDWQKTKRLVYDDIFAFVSSISTDCTDFQTEKARSVFEELLRKVSSRIADNFLSACLLTNNSWSHLSREEAKRRLKHLSFGAQLKTFGHAMRSAASKL